MAIIGGLTTDELTEPGSVSPHLVSEALAVLYAGLVARAQAKGGTAADTRPAAGKQTQSNL